MAESLWLLLSARGARDAISYETIAKRSFVFKAGLKEVG